MKAVRASGDAQQGVGNDEGVRAGEVQEAVRHCAWERRDRQAVDVGDVGVRDRQGVPPVPHLTAPQEGVALRRARGPPLGALPSQGAAVDHAWQSGRGPGGGGGASGVDVRLLAVEAGAVQEGGGLVGEAHRCAGGATDCQEACQADLPLLRPGGRGDGGKEVLASRETDSMCW